MLVVFMKKVYIVCVRPEGSNSPGRLLSAFTTEKKARRQCEVANEFAPVGNVYYVVELKLF